MITSDFWPSELQMIPLQSRSLTDIRSGTTELVPGNKEANKVAKHMVLLVSLFALSRQWVFLALHCVVFLIRQWSTGM